MLHIAPIGSALFFFFCWETLPGRGVAGAWCLLCCGDDGTTKEKESPGDLLADE